MTKKIEGDNQKPEVLWSAAAWKEKLELRQGVVALIIISVVVGVKELEKGQRR